MTHFLEQRAKDDIPYIFPLNLMYDTKHTTFSEKKRFEKLTKTFSNLKYLIESNPDNENIIVKEVIIHSITTYNISS